MSHQLAADVESTYQQIKQLQEQLQQQAQQQLQIQNHILQRGSQPGQHHSRLRNCK